MRLLLDAHLSPLISRVLIAESIDAESLEHWQGGRYRHAHDEQILIAAATDDRVLVSYDVHSIPATARELRRTGQRHAGVVLVSKGTIRPGDIGGLIRALRHLEATPAEQPVENQVIYLRRAPHG